MTPSGCHPYAMGLGRICFTPRDLFPPLEVRRVATLASAPPGGVALSHGRVIRARIAIERAVERADMEGR